MKTTNQQESSQIAKSDSSSRRPKQLWLAAFIGMDIGVLGGAAYLLYGGEVIWNIPSWAMIAFYPGLWVGSSVWDHWRVYEGTAAFIGLITVGLAYGVIAVLIRLAWNYAKRKN